MKAYYMEVNSHNLVTRNKLYYETLPCFWQFIHSLSNVNCNDNVILTVTFRTEKLNSSLIQTMVIDKLCDKTGNQVDWS